MALRQLRITGDPILRKRSREISEYNDRMAELARDMIETMNVADGIGLAAVQVGVLRRMIVVIIDEEPIVMINPEIVSSEGQVSDYEGCLSVPGKTGKVTRPEKVKVKFKSPEWEDKELEPEELEARAVAHEIDHLNGILYTDKLDGPLYEVEPSDEE